MDKKKPKEMAEFRISIGTKEGRCYKTELKEESADPLLGKKIGDKVDGSVLGLDGYEFEITGGSDKSGFGMKAGIDMPKKRIVLQKGAGIRKVRKGNFLKKSVAGGYIHENTALVNLKVIREGPKPLFEEPKEKESEEKQPAEETEEKPEAKSK